MRRIANTITAYPDTIDPDVLAKEKAASRERWFANLAEAVARGDVTPAPKFVVSADTSVPTVTVTQGGSVIRNAPNGSLWLTYEAHGGTVSKFCRTLDDVPAVLADIRRATRSTVINIDFGGEG